MQALNGVWLVAAIIAIIAFITILFFWLHHHSKKRRYLDYSNYQLEKQNKNFNFPDAWDDGVGTVRILPAEQDTSIFDEEEVFASDASTTTNAWPKVISIYVKSKPHENFYGYDLMQSILNQGLVHGTMNFFHYSAGRRTLFSLTSTEPPGSFDLNNMGAFKTSGLCLFLQPHRFQKPVEIFEKMVVMGQQIAEELGGVLEDEHHHILTPERLNYWKSELGGASE